MATHIFNRNGGKTDEAGHLKFVTSAFTGNVLDGLVVKQNSPLSLGVLIEPGTLKIDYSDYGYTGDNDADALVTIATADSSNPRIDRIVAYVDRGMTPSPASPNNPGMLKFMAVSGTPAGSPVRPNDVTVNSAVGASNPWCDLADVLVGTGVTTIDDGKITDKRVFIQPLVQLETASYANASVTPAKLSSRTKMGTISAGSTSTVSGLPFKPKSVEFYRFANSGTGAFGYGISNDDDTHFAVSATATTTVSSTFSVINSTGNGATNLQGKVTAFTDDGFTLTMTTTASVTFLYVARG